jgi:hypothetical protein
MKKINVIKVGKTLNISIDGKLYKKVCSTDTEANEIFREVLKTKENPTDDALKHLRVLVNEKTRTLYMVGLKELEADIENGEVYLAGFNTPVPKALVDIIKEYHENGFPLKPILNFWKLLMINPDTRVRTSLFDFISKHDFVLTDKGYMLVYKAVYRKSDYTKEEVKPEVKLAETFIEFVSTKYLYVKSQWKCSPNKYVVYKTTEGKLEITKATTAETWNEKEKGVEILGKLGDLYAALVTADNKKADEEQTPIKVQYTDMHSKTMTIELGVPCQKPRSECDGDPEIECSYGLHVGGTRYVENYANRGSVILACLVNPANVVAVPKYDHSKMRVCEYFPYGVANFINSKIEIIESKYFEDDYATFEQKELEEMVAKVRANELPIQQAIKAEKESRPMSELLKIVETRIFDVS